MRVVITGVGLICPAGVGLDAALARLAEGPLPPSPWPEPGAPEGLGLLTVPGEAFKPRAFLKRPKDQKLMARANLLAVAAAKLALAQAGITEVEAGGIFLGVGREPGNLDEIVPALAHARGPDGGLSLDRLLDEGMGYMNPLASLKTLPNMSVAHVAIQCGLAGPSMALCSEAEAGARALYEGALAVLEGRAPFVLAGAADDRADFTARVAAWRLGLMGPASEGAALFVLETEAHALARGATILGELGAFAAEEAPALALGDAGAATAALALALAVGRGQAAGVSPVSVGPLGTGALFPAQPRIAIAITAQGLRTPLGDEPTAFARALLAGVCPAGPIQAFDAHRFPTKLAAEVQTRAPDPYDDRKTALALGAAMDAVRAHGALSPEAAVIFGTGLSSVSVEELTQDCLPFIDADGHFDHRAFFAHPQSAPQSPTRHLVERPIHLLRERLELKGPWACHFSACAAGSAAIAHAMDLLRRGEAPMALVGSADSMIHPFGLLPFILLGATTRADDPALGGRPFERTRDGFLMGEGAAFFVLEPEASARAAGRPILGLLLGSGTSEDAYSVTAPPPDGAGAERAMRAALTDAGLSPSAIDYVNAHGTGTPLNDSAEGAAVRRLFGEVPVSSSKAQLGHAIAAAGAVELAACLAALDAQTLPPNARLSQPDPQLAGLDLVGPTGRPASVRRVLSNSFGFGGQNACLIVAHPGGRA